MAHTPQLIMFIEVMRRCGEKLMKGSFGMVDLAISIWILSLASVKFAQAYQIIKKTNRQG